MAILLILSVGVTSVLMLNFTTSKDFRLIISSITLGRWMRFI